MAEPYVLEAKLDLSAAAALHETLMELTGRDSVLDAQRVTHMGALCTQLLIAAGRKAGEGGHKFSIVNTSDRVLAQLSAMGLSPEMIAEGHT